MNNIGAYMYLVGTYKDSVLTTAFGSYAATLSPRCIASLQNKQSDFNNVLLKVVPVTKPEAVEYDASGRQRAYLGFIVEEVSPEGIDPSRITNEVHIVGKVINEKRGFRFALVKVYYPYMLNQFSIIKVNGLLSGYGDALDSIYQIKAEVKDNELYVTSSERLTNTIELADFSTYGKSNAPKPRLKRNQVS